jgi:hypothetical protein
VKQSSERLLENINVRLANLEETHSKDVPHLMMALAEIKAELFAEVKHHKAAIERAFLDIRAADKRLANIEKLLHNPIAPSIHVKFPVLDFFRRYWHVLAIIGSLISFILSYFFGYTIKSSNG